MSIRVVAVEDDPRYRASLEVLFLHAEDFALVKTFPSPEAALAELDAALARQAAPGWDLVLMDLELPAMSGIECTRILKQRLPGTAVVVLTVFEDRTNILQAICAGADGYLLKRTPADRLLTQLRAVVAGGSPLSVGVARTVLELLRHFGSGAASPEGNGAARFALTEREHEVLRCLAQGMSYKRVSAYLGISVHTVRTHVRGIYAKLQVHSVAEVVSCALRERLV